MTTVRLSNLDEVKLTGSVVEEVRIVPVGNKFTLEGD